MLEAEKKCETAVAYRCDEAERDMEPIRSSLEVLIQSRDRSRPYNVVLFSEDDYQAMTHGTSVSLIIQTFSATMRFSMRVSDQLCQYAAVVFSRLFSAIAAQ